MLFSFTYIDSSSHMPGTQVLTPGWRYCTSKVTCLMLQWNRESDIPDSNPGLPNRSTQSYAITPKHKQKGVFKEANWLYHAELQKCSLTRKKQLKYVYWFSGVMEGILVKIRQGCANQRLIFWDNEHMLTKDLIQNGTT